jgi:chromosome partitioning protein
VPATVDLSGAEVELVAVDHRTDRLRHALSLEAVTAAGGYDICFIDCPPSLGLLTLNALTAADTLLVPLQCEFFALEGLSQLLQTVERVQQRFNAELGIIGVALTMFDRRNRLTDQVSTDVRQVLGGLVFDTAIPRNVRLSEAPSHGLPALIYDQYCAGSKAYMALARELIARLPEQGKPHERGHHPRAQPGSLRTAPPQAARSGPWSAGAAGRNPARGAAGAGLALQRQSARPRGKP